jgi:hypothetical protein
MPTKTKTKAPASPSFLNPALTPWVLISEIYWMPAHDRVGVGQRHRRRGLRGSGCLGTNGVASRVVAAAAVGVAGGVVAVVLTVGAGVRASTSAPAANVGTGVVVDPAWRP